MKAIRSRTVGRRRREEVAIRMAGSDWHVRQDGSLGSPGTCDFFGWLLRDRRHPAAVREFRRVRRLLNASRFAGRGPAFSAMIDVLVARRAPAIRVFPS